MSVEEVVALWRKVKPVAQDGVSCMEDNGMGPNRAARSYAEIDELDIAIASLGKVAD